MSIDATLVAIQGTGLARAITKSNHMVIAGLQVAHVFGLLLLLAALILITLRLLGWVLLREQLSQVIRTPVRMFWCGLALVLLSGAMMFLSGPKHYFYNRAFEVKMLLLVLAVAAQVPILRRLADDQAILPPVKLAAALSLVLWFGIAVAGRAIGFV